PRQPGHRSLRVGGEPLVGQHLVAGKAHDGRFAARGGPEEAQVALERLGGLFVGLHADEGTLQGAFEVGQRVAARGAAQAGGAGAPPGPEGSDELGQGGRTAWARRDRRLQRLHRRRRGVGPEACQVKRRSGERQELANATQATAAASFWSLPHGAPSPRPRSASRRGRPASAIRKARAARAASFREGTAVTSRPASSLAKDNAARKSSPSAECTKACERRIAARSDGSCAFDPTMPAATTRTCTESSSARKPSRALPRLRSSARWISFRAPSGSISAA